MTTITDILGRPCTPEAALDNPETWMDAKGARLPATCFETPPPRTKEALAWSIGREPTEREWRDFGYHHCRYFDDCGFGVPGIYVASTPPAIPPVPLPSGGALLASVLVVVALWRVCR